MPLFLLDIGTALAVFYSRFANSKHPVNLKPQDILFLLKLVALGKSPWSFKKLAIELGMSPAEVHAAARGESFSPLYKSVPVAAKNDPKLYELLVLVDALRGGRARERDVARKELKQRLALAAKQKDEPMMSERERLLIGGALVISRTALRKLAQRYHIQRLSLFGSAARGELRPDSDIDLLVEFENGAAPSLGGVVEIQDAFVTLFGGRKVDVANRHLHGRMLRICRCQTPSSS